MRFDGSEVDGTKDRLRKMTFKELVTFRRNHDQPFCHGQSEIGRTDLGGNQEERENVGKSRVSAIISSRVFSQFSPQFSKMGPILKIGKKNGETFGERAKQDERTRK